MTPPTAQAKASLSLAICGIPIVDHHAHPLLRPGTASKPSLLSIVSEAREDGGALETSKSSLAHLRAVRQLSKALACPCTWDAVASAIKTQHESNSTSWTARCLSGIHCVLVDDGLHQQGDAESYRYLDNFTPAKTKRIVRIEQIALAPIAQACSQRDCTSADAFAAFEHSYEALILEALADSDVAAFKSVICYRTGLAIPQLSSREQAQSAFSQIFKKQQDPNAHPLCRIAHAGLNEFLVHLLAATINAHETKKPIQFHTGLGDNDITLTLSSPAHLQTFIRRYPAVPIVLLHAGYPFVRETAYLAAVYSNVFADIGEVFPVISRDGQHQVLRQILEICPSQKILWSTDGHDYPETYLLAVMQMREVLHDVLRELLSKGDLTHCQAVNLARAVLFENANELYHLDVKMKEAEQHVSDLGEPHELLEVMQGVEDSTQYLRVWWSDMTAITRSRVIPLRRAKALLQSEEGLSLGVAQASLGMLQNDRLIPGASATGEWRLHPDFGSARRGPRPGYLSVTGNFKHQEGSPVELCPRTLLQNVLSLAEQEGLTFKLGFEIEFVLFRIREGGVFEALDRQGHAWSNAQIMDAHPTASVVEDMMECLHSAGVFVEMVHPESAPGQFEIVLPQATPLQAVDTLIFARSVVYSCAASHGFRATLHPKPFSSACGTAAHVHMSISSHGGQLSSCYEPFYAGILTHMRAITAFACSNVASYDRLADSCWSGGTWISWGTQNREAPLRKIQHSHWELKLMDGLCNPYLVMAAILTAGIDGIRNRTSLTWADCTSDPASLSDEERGHLAIRSRLPACLEEALDALRQDRELVSLLGSNAVERYVAVKRAEIELLKPMEESTRWRWLVERY